MSYELITVLMFALMMLMLATGQRVFAAIDFVAVLSALLLWGDRGGYDLGFAAAMKLMKWYPLLTLPMFIFMGYVLSESKIADDLYRMFHVWTGGMAGGLAMGTTVVVLGRRGEPARARDEDAADLHPRRGMGAGGGRRARLLGRDRGRIGYQGQGGRHLQAVQRGHGEGRKALPLHLTPHESAAPQHPRGRLRCRQPAQRRIHVKEP